MVEEIMIRTDMEVTVLYAKDIKVIRFFKDRNLYIMVVDLTTKYFKKTTPEAEHVPHFMGLPPPWSPYNHEDHDPLVRKWFITRAEMEKFLHCKEKRIVLNAYSLYGPARRYVLFCENEQCGYKRIFKEVKEIHDLPRGEKEFVLQSRCPHCYSKTIATKTFYVLPSEVKGEEEKNENENGNQEEQE